LVEALGQRAERVTHDTAAGQPVREMTRHRLNAWARRRGTLPTGRLGYVDDGGITGELRDPDAAAGIRAPRRTAYGR
jgi:hypothetical protein